MRQDHNFEGFLSSSVIEKEQFRAFKGKEETKGFLHVYYYCVHRCTPLAVKVSIPKDQSFTHRLKCVHL